MKTPTLEEVKEHFKYAKSIRSSYDGRVHVLDNKNRCVKFEGQFYMIGCRYQCLVFSNGEYAEIVEYKDEYLKGIQDKYYKDHVGIRKEAFEKGGIIHEGDEDIIMPNFKLTTDENIQYLKTHKPMEANKNNTEITISFETVGGVSVTLTGKNLENLNTICNMIK